MTSSSSKGPVRNVPSPAGSKAGSAYTRFIPREELQGFAAWQPKAFAEAPAFLQPAQGFLCSHHRSLLVLARAQAAVVPRRVIVP